MIKCRAKMIDGSPVTFDLLPEETVTVGEHPHIQRECIGHGLHVVSSSYAYWGGTAQRYEAMRSAIERAGVYTATAEMWKLHPDGVLTRVEQKKPGIISFECGRWVRLFPPMVRGEPCDMNPGGLGYFAPSDSPRGPTWEMVAAGSAALHDMVIEEATIVRGQVWFQDSRKVVTEIWKRMEKEILK